MRVCLFVVNIVLRPFFAPLFSFLHQKSIRSSSFFFSDESFPTVHSIFIATLLIRVFM
jgi:hypothetical protein